MWGRLGSSGHSRARQGGHGRTSSAASMRRARADRSSAAAASAAARPRSSRHASTASSATLAPRPGADGAAPTRTAGLIAAVRPRRTMTESPLRRPWRAPGDGGVEIEARSTTPEPQKAVPAVGKSKGSPQKKRTKGNGGWRGGNRIRGVVTLRCRGAQASGWMWARDADAFAGWFEEIESLSRRRDATRRGGTHGTAWDTGTREGRGLRVSPLRRASHVLLAPVAVWSVEGDAASH